MAKPGRNDPCHCGSGKKYKKCCQPKEQAAEHKELIKAQLRREEARRVELRRFITIQFHNHMVMYTPR